MAMAGERGKAFLAKSREMLGDVQKAAAFRAIVRQAQEDEVEKQLEGKTVEDLSPRARAALERTRKMLREMPVHDEPAKDEKVVDIRSARLGRVLSYVGTAAAAAMVILVLGKSGKLPETAYPVAATVYVPINAGASPVEEARQRAMTFCAMQRYAQCLADLNDARNVDPTGETPEIRTVRRIAESALADASH